jgi:hypothetical protein
LPAPLFVILLSGVTNAQRSIENRSVEPRSRLAHDRDDSHGRVVHPAAICAASCFCGGTRRTNALFINDFPQQCASDCADKSRL